jgi:succinate dehydrogenase / fumarate reductase iron-sulfur subunit
VRVELRILRRAPGKGPYWQAFSLETEGRERVLDLLLRVKAEVDGTLAFRHSCGHGVCGSDAITINGQDHLACKTLVKDLGRVVTVEPLRALPARNLPLPGARGADPPRLGP